jgi:hypothetical protein
MTMVVVEIVMMVVKTNDGEVAIEMKEVVVMMVVDMEVMVK